MKIRRYKKVNKNLGFFTNTYGFRQPYQVLVDGTFCFAALKNKINIADNIPRYLQAEIKLITTQCAIIEMENLGPKLNGALLILKNYSLHKCGHEGKPILGSKCFLSMLGKTNIEHYIVATQDRDLQSIVRNIPGVPLLYLHLKTPVLEQPSEASVKFAQEKMLGLREHEKLYFEKLKEKSGIVDEERPKKKKKKGPNPLSCKKKKKPTMNTTSIKEGEQTVTQKKKRKRIKIPKHVIDELKNKSS
ncbi:rRNA-processing protein UTP23 homolog [Leptinotarsa decemlineata]|uniref:rRNA-processing protein UTP23 homolog n=1 Tax=Leptinotarsa decemlineata TaxID=7539 RepID=UPI003D30952C